MKNDDFEPPEREYTDEEIQQESYEIQKDEFLDELHEFITTKYKDRTLKDVIEKTKYYIQLYEKCFLDEDYDKEFIADLKKSLKFDEDIIQQQLILQIPISKEEQKEAEKQAETLQFKYENSLWRKLFNQWSCHNELYGQALFHITLGIICDLEINAKDEPLWARPNLFYIQRTRTGKNKGMYFVEKVLNQCMKNGRKIFIKKGGKQTDATLIDRYAVELTKSGNYKIKKDDDSNPIIVNGILSTTDLIWYPEANYLLNPTSRDNQEAINIHLNLLERGGTYEKDLASWQGMSTITHGGHYAMVALTRPIKNIKEHILFSGLLQRCIFIPRLISKQDRKIMREKISLILHRTDEIKNEFRKDFDNLINELKEIQNFININKIAIKDEDSEKIRQFVYSKMELLSIFAEQQFLTEQNLDTVEDFIGNYSDHMLILAYQTAAIRKSQFVELVDFEYSFNFLQECLNCFIPWLEESIEQEKKTDEKQLIRTNKIKKFVTEHKREEMKFSTVVNEFCNLLHCSQMTARKYIIYYSEQPYIYYKIDVESKMISF